MMYTKYTLLLLLVHVGTPTPIKHNKLRDVDWFSEGQKAVQKILDYKQNVGRAKNVILFVGDGMGLSTINAARLLKAQTEDANLFHTKLAWEIFPDVALSMTYGVNQFVAASGQTATAILTGVKTNSGVVGAGPGVTRSVCSSLHGHELESLIHRAHKLEKWTGIVTTDALTGATPASAYAHTAERDWQTDDEKAKDRGDCKDIAAQLIEDNHFIRVLLGGGRAFFTGVNETDPVYNTAGMRLDNRNLIELWRQKQEEKTSRDNVKYVTDKAGMDGVNLDSVQYLLGLFEPEKMHQELDRTNPSINRDEEPTLAELTEKAIKVLKRGKNGYILLVEGARIDNGHHQGKAKKALYDTLALSDAVAKAVEVTNPEETLIVVTADHSHVFSMGGYSHPDNDIFGLAREVKKGSMDELELKLGEDGLPFLSLVYGNGPGYVYHKTNGSLSGPTARKNLTTEEADGTTGGTNYLQDTAVPRDSETHSAEEVAVYVRGPMSHTFRGLLEQNYITHLILRATCMPPYTLDDCNIASSALVVKAYTRLTLTIIAFIAMAVYAFVGK